MNICAFALEIYFAITFGISGLTKVKDPEYFASVLQQQHILPAWSIRAISHIFPWGELVIAVLFLVEGTTLGVAVVGVALFGMFLGVKCFLFLSGYSQDCGCYGAATKQKIDSVSFIVSFLLLVLSATHLGLVIQGVAISWTWHIGALAVYGAGGGWLLFKIAANGQAYPESSDRPARGLDVGIQAPLFAAIDQHNTTISLEGVVGNPCILAFVLPGCSACPGAIDAISQFLQKERQYRGLVMSRSPFERTCEYAAKFENRLPFLTPEESLLEEYQVSSFPFVYVLDEHRFIRAKGVINNVKDLHVLVRHAFTHEISSKAFVQSV